MSTYLSLNYHIIFATKNRTPAIEAEWKTQLHDYLAGIVRNQGGIPMAINGIEDHVHMLVGLKATHCLADFLREVKKSSSQWVHREVKRPHFAWQEGYAGLAVSAEGTQAVKTYIANQEEHHKAFDSREELLRIVKRQASRLT